MSDFKRDERFYRYAQIATAYAFTRGMIEAGVDSELIVDVNWIANTEWGGIMERYESLMAETPPNTRGELADLEYEDLVRSFDTLDTQFNEALDNMREDEE